MLENKDAIIFGATSDFGKEIAKRFMNEGVRRLYLHGRSLERLKSVNIPNAFFVTDYKEVGEVDIMVYCPGILGDENPIGFLQVDKDFSTVLEVNLMAPMRLLDDIKIRDGGSIILLSSINSFEPMACESAYCTTKSGLKQLVEVSACKFRRRGIRVNSISPGMVKTKFHRPYFDTEEEMDEFFEEIQKDTCLGRLGTVGGVADPVLFLSSDLSKDITGVEIVVDCGATLKTINMLD